MPSIESAAVVPDDVRVALRALKMLFDSELVFELANGSDADARLLSIVCNCVIGRNLRLVGGDLASLAVISVWMVVAGASLALTSAWIKAVQSIPPRLPDAAWLAI